MQRTEYTLDERDLVAFNVYGPDHAKAGEEIPADIPFETLAALHEMGDVRTVSGTAPQLFRAARTSYTRWKANPGDRSRHGVWQRGVVRSILKKLQINCAWCGRQADRFHDDEPRCHVRWLVTCILDTRLPDAPDHYARVRARADSEGGRA